MNKEYIKCVVVGKSITACQLLSEALEYGNPTGTSKGIFIPERVNIKTGEPGTDIVQIHSGCFRKNGIAANFCPFCGESLVTWWEE
ncbi:hypothetical protein B6O39_001986 [Salmonella enterica subsp. enterica serovar Javiana]|nr:hypothetical protein [Salmonella enterica subsp. enterica serovar Javiana]EJM2519996.1 hypothetical protein [Salmonella enterica]ELE2248460.1 hypothetical protein [Salmonella enterica]